MFFIVVFITQSGMSQKRTYFPQEKLIHPKCAKSNDTNSCLDSIVETKLLLILNLEKTKRLFYEDTLRVAVIFPVSKKGHVFEDYIKTSYYDEVITPRLEKSNSYYLKQLPQFKIKNRKPRPYNSFHRFEYKYVINYDDHKTLKKIKIPYQYTGGVITEVPLFPDCKRTDGFKDRLCFNDKLKNHVSKYFQYPEEAQQNNLQGIVNTSFTVGKDGIPFNFIATGVHKLLEDEALRILSLLPKLKPGMKNGIPVEVPYTFPITFRIQ